MVSFGQHLSVRGALAATSRLARRNGQALKLMRWSFRHGYTAEFFEPKDHRADT